LIRRVAVVIPATNEERHIGSCLASVDAARARLYRSSADIRVRIVVVLDSCSDATAALAAASGGIQLVTIAARSVGVARRAGTSAAMDGGGRLTELWLANTDADSLVPADWLTRMTAEAEEGAHLVLGTVTPGPDLSPWARAEWAGRHHLRDGHPHVHGANFGIRGDVYLALGGWPPVVTGEDARLAQRAAGTGHLQISRTASIPVVTSVRRQARAPRGFSSYLRSLGSETLTGVGHGSAPW
jgi:glycosyltransferase involved in cell wall biosynthesis